MTLNQSPQTFEDYHLNHTEYVLVDGYLNVAREAFAAGVASQQAGSVAGMNIQGWYEKAQYLEASVAEKRRVIEGMRALEADRLPRYEAVVEAAREVVRPFAAWVKPPELERLVAALAALDEK